MNHTIISTAAFKLEVKATQHAGGTTLFVITTWPAATNPEPHVPFSVTLTSQELVRLRDALDGMVREIGPDLA